MKSIYNKKVLGVILILTLLVSIGFYFLNKEDQVDKDKLYENKLAQHNKKNADKNYGVSTNNKIAREVGNKIIQDGGNSADAAYGVAYTLAVTEPYAAGLGGEGTSLTYDGKKNSQPKVYDYSAMSSYNYKNGQEIGVPGFVKGMHDMHQKEGSMSEKKILNYVIPLAEDGFQVNNDLAKLLSKYSGNIDKNSPFFKDGQVLKTGDVVKQEHLANTLKDIRDKGDDYFYKEMGDNIAKQSKGSLTARDFKDYKTKEKKPISTNYLGNTVYTSPNPTSGMLTLQALKIDQSINGNLGEDNRKDFIESVVEARNVNFKNRYLVNGKEDNNDKHMDDSYLTKRAEQYKKLKNKFGLQGQVNTAGSHFVIVDKQGKMTSSTNTLNNFFGSGDYTKQGFFMNNALKRFSKAPASANHGGPHKAPRSFISPTITVGDNYYVGAGTPGGNKVPTMMHEVLSTYLRGNDSLQATINKPRFYNDGKNLYYEDGMSDKDIKIFKDLGFKPQNSFDNPNFGSVQGATYFKKDKKTETGHDVEVR